MTVETTINPDRTITVRIAGEVTTATQAELRGALTLCEAATVQCR